jgi:toxin YoeB
VKLAFTPTGWDDLNYWADKDRGTYKKVRALLKEVVRTPFEGTGKPEPLKYQLGSVWSRRITQEHRLVYAVEDDQIVVLEAGFHYDLPEQNILLALRAAMSDVAGVDLPSEPRTGLPRWVGLS